MLLGQDLAVHDEGVGAARFEQQEAVGVVLAMTTLKSMLLARSFLRSACTEVVPVVVATVLPFRSLMELMPSRRFTAMRTSST